MTQIYQHKISMKAWAESDQPREKMMAQGRQNMSNAELLAILLGSGSRTESALSLAQIILGSTDLNLHTLGQLSFQDLMKFNGVGKAKAASMAAAFELGRRHEMYVPVKKPKITDSLIAWKILAPLLMDLSHEEFWILILNRSNRVIGKERTSVGGVSGTVADGKIIFRKALSYETATSVILCHNHPSGNPQPSQADIQLTKKLKQGGEQIDMSVLDHLIIAGDQYYSFADEGML